MSRSADYAVCGGGTARQHEDAVSGKTVPRRMGGLDMNSEPLIPAIWARKNCGDGIILEALFRLTIAVFAEQMSACSY